MQLKRPSRRGGLAVVREQLRRELCNQHRANIPKLKVNLVTLPEWENVTRQAAPALLS